jgi:HEPN domain-containing protein
MDKEQHIEKWMKQALEDWEVVMVLLAAEKYGHALFWAHLVCEKLCKAIWIKHNEKNIPPRSHNLNFILSETNLEVSTEFKILMIQINQYNIMGRYPDDIETLESKVSKEKGEKDFEQLKQLKSWMLEQLQ